jgi:hypothetical protein
MKRTFAAAIFVLLAITAPAKADMVSNDSIGNDPTKERHPPVSY